MSIFAPVQQSGKKNIADLQRLINLMGHSRLNVDGILGSQTTRAIWTLPDSASAIVDDFARTRQVAYPRAPKAPKGSWSKDKIINTIRQMAVKVGVNPDLAVAVAIIESDLDINATSPTGAAGLFQLTTSAIRDVAQDFVDLYRPSGRGRFEVMWNIEVGVRYLHRIMTKYLRVDSRSRDIGVWTDTYAAYNIGIGNFRRLNRREYDNPDLVAALDLQARYLSAGGPSKYLAAVQSKLESVIT
jgi:soluble lytic murein transglycosylase-like protein